MLAPRKKLWSTPSSAIQMAERLLLQECSKDEVFYDVGCGDGRVLLHFAATGACRQCVGIEIEKSRAELIIQAAAEAWNVQVRSGVNALDVTDYHKASIIYLYLVPRGLRLILPLLKEAARQRRRLHCVPHHKNQQERVPVMRIVTYMAKFPGETHVKKEVCPVEHQEGAQWPMYLYHFYGDDNADDVEKRNQFHNAKNDNNDTGPELLK